ncbi:MAG: hypothetical protein UT33_C0015G0040 [Candidatus Peregrinibacteria bacterium GW2011_GWC2_39_14]|nr:MAG: hypothetical protein US92_C0009G0008 [Candidatus Peregrinibacteria bacterium GW2011_GWA2_38_36]KKR04983.1 MAG: hypothetical protein UT33_C0015G0040 [Candidatus Peregrinibacteria bacterium GW2011_GWC2_39_14]
MQKETKNQEKKKSNVFASLSLAWELGYTIALPIAILGFGGAYADKRLGTVPLFILIGIALAIIISGIGIYRKVKNIVN